MAVSLALNPYVYGACFGLISRFKSDSPPLDFSVGRIGGCQAALTLSILRRFDLMAAKRHENGMLLINGLKGLKEITVSEISGSSSAAFNRFPIVLTDRGSRDIAARRLWRAGIETSRMYNRPLHHMFDLGYGAGDFPNACYVAERLLTLPAHPSIGRDRLSKAVDVIRGALK
jgi:dTDP-4-amino-4,6-dideoxygalactose transaminase